MYPLRGGRGAFRFAHVHPPEFFKFCDKGGKVGASVSYVIINYVIYFFLWLIMFHFVYIYIYMANNVI